MKFGINPDSTRKLSLALPMLACLFAGTAFAYTPVYRNLPAGYTQVEYIQSSGSQYVDLGVPGRSGLASEIVMSYVSVPSDSGFCGARKGNDRLYLCYHYGRWTYGYGNYYRDPSSANSTAAAGAIYRVCTELRNGCQGMNVFDDNNTQVAALSGSLSADYDTGYTFHMFGLNYGGSSSLRSSGRCYSAKFWNVDSEGARTLAYDFVPCVNGSGTAGLYDIENGQFHAPNAALTYGNFVQKAVDPSQYTGNVFIGNGVEGNWNVAANWSMNSVPTTSDDVVIADRTVYSTGAVAVKSLHLIGGTLKVGDDANRTPFTDNVALSVTGDVTVESNACLIVYAGRLPSSRLADLAHADTTAYRALYENATLVNVGGKLKVDSGGSLCPDCDPLTGTAVFFRPANFELADGGVIDVRKRGWRWFKTAAGDAPVGVRYEKQTSMYHTYAFGPGYSSAHQGGGYGTAAFNAASAAVNTFTNIVDGVVYGESYIRGGSYGSAYAPFLPGSQGGVYDDATLSVNRAAGAAVVQVTGNAVVNGRILAYGEQGSDWAHASGGSIWIAAADLKVAPYAVFDVHGGNTTNSARMPGAAGRVALMDGVGTAAEWAAFAVTTDLPNGYAAENRRLPGIVNVFGGDKGGYSNANPAYSHWRRPALGTAVLVMPGTTVDATGVETAIAQAQTGIAREWIGGDGYFDRPDSWNPAGVPSAQDSLTIASGICRAPAGIDVASLTVGAGARLEVASWYMSGYTDSVAWPLGTSGVRKFAVSGNAEISGVVTIGGGYTNTFDAVTGLVCRVGGDLVVKGTGKLLVTAAATDGPLATSNDVYAARTVFQVGGTLAVRDTAKLIPICDPFGGLPVQFKAGNFELGDAASVDAVNRGYDWLPDPADPRARNRWRVTTNNNGGQSLYMQSMLMSPASGYTIGAGHGADSPNHTVNFGLAYGNPYAPFLAGSSSYIYNWHAKDGGGVVWIAVTNEMTVGGQVTASASSVVDASYTGGSGGSIWLSAKNGVEFGLNASLVAKGSIKARAERSGAGGRISVASGVTDAQLEQIAAGVDPESLGLTVSDSVSGVVTDVTSADGYPASAGTVTAVHGVISKYEVIVVPSGIAAMAPSPNYGSALYENGEYWFSAPSYGGDPDEPDVLRYKLAGYVVSNATEEVAFGSTRGFWLRVDENLSLYWIWDTETKQRPVDIDGVRNWAVVGSDFNMTASVSAENEFLYWIGNVPRGKAAERTFTFTVKDKPYSFSAVTRPRQNGTMMRRWKESKNGSWYDPECWEDGIIPGPNDPVELGYYSTITASNIVMCGSLSMTANYVTLKILPGGDDIFEEAGLFVADDVSVSLGSKLSVGSLEQKKAVPVISVGGDFRINGGTVTVYAGEIGDGFTFASGAGFINVGNEFELAGNSKLVLWSEPYSGGSVKTVCRKFILCENALVDADGKGFAVDKSRTPYSLSPGKGSSYDIGAGHGGHGGSANGTYGAAYGFANSPVVPGSESGVYLTYAPNAGGGLIRIHARDMDVRGTVNANAERIGGQIVAASGGGIWLTADHDIKFGTNAVLTATGSIGHAGNSAGAGGRIAVGYKLTPQNLEELARTGTYIGLVQRRVHDAAWFTDKFSLVTAPDLSPGVVGSNPETTAQPGTFTFVDGTNKRLMLIFK